MAVKKTKPAKKATTAGRNVPQLTSGRGTFDDALQENEVVLSGDAPLEVSDEPVQDTGLAKYSQAPVFDASDLFIPKLRLAQGLTAEVQSGLAKPGDWLVLGSDPIKSPTIIPMLMVKRRELRDTDDNRAVLCRSADSIVGVGNPGGECATCPMSKWVQSNKPGGKNSAPPCNFIYSYIVYVVETEELCVLEFYRTSIATGKMLNTMILQKGIGNFAVTLKSTSQQGPRGTYYQASAQPAAKVKEDVIKKAKAKAAEMF